MGLFHALKALPGLEAVDVFDRAGPGPALETISAKGSEWSRKSDLFPTE